MVAYIQSDYHKGVVVKRYDEYILLVVLNILFFSSFSLSATVAPILQGQSLWWIVKRIGLAVDTIESKVDLIDTSTTGAACGIVELDSMSVSGGLLTISDAGSYCLKEDITANVTISTSCVQLDMNGRCITGTITVGAGGSEQYIVVKNGFVTPAAPTGAGTKAIDVQAGTSQIFIENVVIECTDSAALGGVEGRDGIEVAGADVQIKNCTITAGAGGSDAGGTGGAGGDSIEIVTGASGVVISNAVLIGGDGGDESSGTAGAGGHGIAITDADDVVFEACMVFRAGIGGAATAGGTAGDGGHGIAFITTASNNIFVKDCTIQKSGDGGTATGGGNGGDGGDGVSVASVSNTKVAVSNCIISDTGAGGNGTTGGNGGSGVFIGSSNTDISVRNCTISNSGAAGTGGSPTAGFAINDDVAPGTGATSKIYANFAHDIANAINFDLQASGSEQGFALSNPPTSTAVSVYANVFI